jgi:exodeoxyribonuclease VII large subunit
MISENKGISLYELQKRIKESISSTFDSQLWIRGEVNGVKINQVGHCYIDLIDKEEKDSGIRAKGQAIVWSSSWKVLRPYFESNTGVEFGSGISILIKVQVNYSEMYGLSLIVYDIDPAYSVGEFEMERQKTINRLQQEGMFEMNTTLQIAKFPQKFAIVSAESAAGYQDFMRHLHENEYGFQFYTELFTAPMQGASAPVGIIAALDKVMERVENGAEFDAVLILRGGGSNVDLHCFDNYDLAVNVAQYPLPVFTAIGHDKDYHVIDMVACLSVKTPTALADYILAIFVAEKNQIKEFSLLLDSLIYKLVYAYKSRIEKEHHRLEMLQQYILRSDPRTIVQKGYSIPTAGTKKITSVVGLKVGDIIEIELRDGKIECQVKKIIPQK